MIYDKKSFSVFMTILFNIFFFLTITKISFGLTNPSNENHDISLVKRGGSLKSASTEVKSKSLYWPLIDGSNNETLKLLNENITETGYWYWNHTFYFDLKALADSKNETLIKDGKLILIHAGVEYLDVWVDQCWKLSNQSAIEGNRVNTTLARVALVPILRKDLLIEGDKYGIASPVELACFERAIDGDPNVPIYNHTTYLIDQLKWDKDSTTTYVQGVLEILKQMKENGTIV